MGSFCGSQTTTTQQQPNPLVMQTYANLIGQAQGVAGMPAYPGQLAMGFTPEQVQAAHNIEGAQGLGAAAPYYDTASNFINAGGNTALGAVPYFGAAQNTLGAGLGAAGAAGNTYNAALGYLPTAGGMIASGFGGLGTAAGYAANSASPVTPMQFSGSAVGQYMSPYTQNVVDATQAQFNRGNAIQANDLLGAGIKAGNAFGGDRLGIAQAELGRNQQMSQAPVIAGLYNSGYGQALNEFNTQQNVDLNAQQNNASRQGQAAQLFQGLGLGAGSLGGQYAGLGGLTGNIAGGQAGLGSLYSGLGQAQAGAATQQAGVGSTLGNIGATAGNLGTNAQNLTMGSAGALMGVGNQSQQTQQNALNSAYQQYLWPFQTTGWLSNIASGLGAGMGGTSSTTAPPPNPFGQILGAAATVAPFFAPSTPNFAPTPNGPGTYAPMFPRARGGMVGGDDDDGIHSASFADFVHPIPVPEIKPQAPAAAPAQQGSSSNALGTIISLGAKLLPMFLADGGSVGGGLGAAGYLRNFGPGAGLQVAPLPRGRGLGIPTPPRAVQAAGLTKDDIANINGISAGLRGLGGATGDYARGGLIPHFDDGGPVDDFADRFRGDLPPRWPIKDESRLPGGGPSIGLRDIDATDVMLDDRNYGFGKPVEHTNPALEADAGGLGYAAMPRARPAGLGVDTGEPMAPGEQSMPFRGLGNVPPAPQPQGLGAAELPPGYAPGSLGPTQPDWRTALMTAGLGMLASRSPNLGTMIGEGGLAGMAYLQKQKDMDAHPVVDHSGPTIRIYYPSERKWIDTGVPTISAAQKAMNERQLEINRERTDARYDANADVVDQRREAQKIRSQTPIKLGQDTMGRDIYGVRDPVTGKYHPIDPATGEVSTQSQPSNTPRLIPAINSTSSQSQSASDDKRGNEADDKGLPAGGAFAADNLAGFVNNDALEGMDSKDANIARAIAEGRQKFLPLTRNNLYNKYIMQKVHEYDPAADETAYSRRQRTATFFAVGTNGGGGQNIAAMNTWAQHMDRYLALTQELGLGRGTTFNDAYTWLTKRGWTSKQAQDKLGQLEVASKAVADEGAKIFAGSQSALADREEWQRILGPGIPAPVALAKAKEVEKLVEGRLISLSNQYNEGMRTKNDPSRFIAPETREIIDRVKSIKDKYVPRKESASNSPAPSAEKSSLPSEARSQLKEGQVTTFGNGQKWTLENGAPVQVK